MRTIRQTGTQRKRQIAKTVLRLIVAEGFTSVTTPRLAQEIGVTSGALFRHFASRDEILEEAVRYAASLISDSFPSNDLPAKERISQLALNRRQLLKTEPGIAWLLRSDQARLVLPPKAVQQLADLVKRSRQFVLEAIVDGVRCGSIRDDFPPEILLVPIMGTIHTLLGLPGVHDKVTPTKTVNPESVLAALMQMLAPPTSSTTPHPQNEG